MVTPSALPLLALLSVAAVVWLRGDVPVGEVRGS